MINNIIPMQEIERINIYKVREHLSNLVKSDQFDPYTELILNQAIAMLEVLEKNLFDDLGS